MSGTGLFLTPGRSIADGVERARLAESLGYHSAWVIQVADREATVVASAYASGTSTIGIGTGVLPLYPRTPVVMAQTAATIDELSGGRFILGIGTSHRLTIEGWHDMELTRPLGHVREYVQAIRAILNGETYAGEIYRTSFTFLGYEPFRRDLPIFISCLSPRMCRLAGEVADGAVLWMCAPSYIESTVVPQIAKGREKAGKTMEGFEIVAAVPLSLTEDPAGGKDAFRRVATVYWTLPFYRAAIERAGLTEAVKAFDEGGPQAIPDNAVEAYAGVGDEEACSKTVQAYRDSGVTIPAISPLPGHEGSASFENLLKALSPSA